MTTRLAVLLGTLMPALVVAQTAPPARSLVFNHVTLIDMTGALPRPDMTVLVVGDRLAAIGRTGTVRVPAGAEAVDATGKYMIPGLWDMHAHVFHYRLPEPPDEYDFPLFIANGVTSIREMWTKLDKMDQVRRWRKQFAEQPGTVPRFAAVGTLVDGLPSRWPNSDTVSTAAEARRLVDELKAGGVDFIKVYDNLSREAYVAIADEAKKQHIPFAGHVPFRMLLREATDAGQRSIEHVTGILRTDCPRIEAMAKTALPKAIATGSPDCPFMEQALELCDDKKAFAAFQHLAAQGTWQVPTLVLHQVDATDFETLRGDERLKYMPGGLDHFNEWTDFNNRLRKRTAEEWDETRRDQQRLLEIVGMMHRAGVRFMAGTDVSNPYLYAGFSLHDELALLVKAGFTPMESLQTATRNPAEFLGLSDSMGTIETRKLADLVLLEANPLDDIHNAQRINAVVVNGTYLSKARLRMILTDAEAKAGKR